MKKHTFLMLFAAWGIVANAITPDALVLSNFGTKDVRPTSMQSATLTYENDPADATNQVMKISMPVNATSYSGGIFANMFYSKYITVGTTSATQYRYLVIRARKGTTNPFEIKLEFNLAAGAITANSKAIQINPIAGTYDYAANQNKWAYYIFDVGGNANANLTYKNLNISPDKGNISTINTTYIDDIYFTNTPLTTDFTTLSPQLAYSRTADEITITHTVPHARSYKIYDGSNTLLSTTTNALNTAITGLTPNTSYTYRISGVNESGAESTKTTVTITTRKNKNATVEVIDDFEGASNIGWYNLSNATVTYNEINPTTNDYNKSEKCAKVYIASGSYNYSGIAIATERITVGPNAPFRYLHFKLKRDADNGSIGVTFLSRWDINQDQKASQTITYAATMVDGNWYDYVFDLKDVSTFPSNATYLGFYIRPNNTSGNTTAASNSYIDDIYLTNSQTASTDNITKKISTSSSSGGTATATATYITGDNVSLTATPTLGNHFVNWTESSSQVSPDATYSFTASTNRTLVANFEPNTVPVSSGTTNASSITCTTCDVTVAAGAELTVGASKTLKSVTVAVGGRLTLSSGAITTTNGITLQNTASGTASFVDERAADNPSAIAGTVEQSITETNRNWYVAVPVSGKFASDITLSGAKIVQRNEALSRWDDVLSGAGLTAGVGYIAVASATSGTTSWSLNGNLNSGKVEVGVTRSGASSIGFNLLGNPYPSYLNWEQVLNLNATNASLLQSSIWYRTKSGASYAFQTYNSAGRVATPTSTTGYIPPMQAFWVRANAAGTVTFTNAMRSHGDGASNKLKAPKVNTQKIIRLQVSNAVVTDEAVIYIDQNAQNTFDKYDTEKMFNNVASQPELYTKAGSEKLVINGLNEISDNQEIPLGLTYSQGGDLKLRLTELNNFDSNTKVYLRDKQLSTETELTPETEYAFNTGAITNNESRFSLVYKVAGVSTGTTPLNNRVSVFVNAANQITIIGNEKSNYAIYNAVGQLIENGILNSKLETRNSKLNSGVYVVKVNNQLTKIIIK